MRHHDKTKHDSEPKMLPLPADDPRCAGMEDGKIMLECSACGFVATRANDSLNIYRACQQAKEAHVPPSCEIVPAAPINPVPDAQVAGSLAPADGLTSGLEPMSICSTTK